MTRLFTFLLLVLPAYAVQAASHHAQHILSTPRVRALHVDGRAFSGTDLYARASPLERDAKACMHWSLYVVDVVPGSYTLGLDYPHQTPPLRVALYDRWPYAPDARHVNLPLGPYRPGAGLEYRWRFGVADGSTSGSLFVMVTTARCGSVLPYRLFVSRAASSPVVIATHGVTYLSGPQGFVLGVAAVPVSYGIDEEGAPPTVVRANLQRQPVHGDLIRNGWFAAGLSGWTVDAGGGVFDVREGALRISGNGRQVMLSQAIDADVTGVAGLVLRAEVRFDAGVAVTATTDEPPFSIVLCYDDIAGNPHCDAGAYRVAFASGVVAAPAGTRYLPAGQWYRYVADIAQLKPAPKRIRSIRLVSSLPVGEAVLLRDLHLTRMDASP